MRRRRLQSIAPVWRLLVTAALLSSMLLGGTARAQTPAVELPEGPLGEQVQWIIDVVNGDVALRDAAAGRAHFAPEFLHATDVEELATSVETLLAEYGPMTLVSIKTTVPDASQAAEIVFEGNDGTQFGVGIIVDLESGLIVQLRIYEYDEGNVTASPATGEPAGPVFWDDIGPSYEETTAALREAGEATMAQFVAGDYEGIAASFAPDLQDPTLAATLEATVAQLTINRVHMEVRDLGIVFDGTWDGQTITGLFAQSGVTDTFSLLPDVSATPAATPAAAGGDVPTGTWSGTLDALGLAFSVTFTGDADSLNATFDVPEQGIAAKAMNGVAFSAERPIGELVDASVLPNGGITNMYRALHAWGTGYLAVTITIAPDGSLLGFAAVPQWPLPSDPAVTSIDLAPLFDGAWQVYWGGETEFRNYHAVTPSQRHAYDLVVWKEGATFANDGLAVEDYYAYGMPYYAPVAGEIVAVESTLPDQPPLVAQLADPALAEAVAASPQIPVGNHVVIRTTDGLYVYLAHMQPDSAQVAVGDTVAVGDAIGIVGNSGNTSEPHIHVHVQTTAAYDDPAAIGVPIMWPSLVMNGEPVADAQPHQGDIIEPVP